MIKTILLASVVLMTTVLALPDDPDLNDEFDYMLAISPNAACSGSRFDNYYATDDTCRIVPDFPGVRGEYYSVNYLNSRPGAVVVFGDENCQEPLHLVSGSTGCSKMSGVIKSWISY